MPSRILLINANRCVTPDPVFPLGLGHLSAALARAGHECVWLDALAAGAEFEQRLKSSQPDFVGISLRNVDDVLIRKRETFFGDLGSLISNVRGATSVPVILGGSAFSIFPRELYQFAGADFGIVGEGENALVALLAAVEGDKDYRNIPGLVFREQGRTLINPPFLNSTACELSVAERPHDITSYYLEHGGTLNLQTQRGCAFRCCYCTYPVIEGRQHRRRPPESVAEEFDQLQRLGAKYVFVVDSVFNSSSIHVAEICEALVKRRIKVPWGCFLRPQGLTRDLLHLMSSAGLAHIEFGSDSFCDEVLEAYGKDFSFEDILASSELARLEGIDYCHYVIAGGPGETEETLVRGFRNSQRLVDAIILAVVGMRIYPGTALFQRAVSERRISQNSSVLTPSYYLAPGLQEKVVFDRLYEFARWNSNWIVGDPQSSYMELVQRLRQRGLAGPLWSYFSLLQRIQPQQLTSIPSLGPYPK